jgi:predicted ribosomally synthesized peptide with nif11-like leader
MEISPIEAFRARINADAGLQEQVRNGADLVALGKANGFNFSQEELQASIDQINSEDADLNDFELSMMSGGFGIYKNP